MTPEERKMLDTLVSESSQIKRHISDLHADRLAFFAVFQAFTIALEAKGAVSRDDISAVLQTAIHEADKVGSKRSAEVIRQFQQWLLRPVSPAPAKVTN